MVRQITYASIPSSVFLEIVTNVKDGMKYTFLIYINRIKLYLTVSVKTRRLYLDLTTSRTFFR